MAKSPREQFPDVAAMADDLVRRGTLASSRGNWQKAAEFLQDAVGLYVAIGDTFAASCAAERHIVYLNEQKRLASTTNKG